MNRMITTALICISLNTGATLAETNSQNSNQPTFLQRIRKLLGITPSVAAAGSRGDRKPVCLASFGPVTITKKGGRSEIGEAISLLPRPVIITATPNTSVRIENETGEILWEQTRTLDAPLTTQIFWPEHAAPIAPGATLILKIQPEGHRRWEVAKFNIIGASKHEMEATQATIESLQAGRIDPHNTVLKALQQDDQRLAKTFIANALATDNSTQMITILTEGCQQLTKQNKAIGHKYIQ